MALGRALAIELVGAVAAALELPIDDARRESVAEHVERLFTAAALVMAFPLPEETEVAPVFDP